MPEQQTELWNAVKIMAEREFAEWCHIHNEPHFNLPHPGRLYAAIIVLSNLEDRYWSFSELSEVKSTDSTRFFGRRSVRNHGSGRVALALTRYGHEDLVPDGELGRTSGGTKEAALHFLHLIRNALSGVPQNELDEQGDALIDYLYRLIFALLEQHREIGGINVSFIASESISAYISKLLDAHRKNPGAVLQHLVGAKLEIRFAGHPISIAHNNSAAADVQTGRLGDFEIGTTVFHVTKRANEGHYEKASRNAENGRRVYLLVPHSLLGSTIDMAEDVIKDISKKVNIFSIEQFVAQNLDELAVFDRSNALRQLKFLLEKYNHLVTTYESDRSLKIVIPDFGID